MYCKKCGANISEQAKFCPKCGNAVIVQTPKKKKSQKVAILVTSLAIFIGALSGIFVFRKDIYSLLFGEKDVYSEVDKVLQEKICCEEFQNANFDDRKEIASEVLSNLEKDKKIKNGSVIYSEDGHFYFNFIDGGEGFITLYEKSNETEGYKMFQDMEYKLYEDEIYSTIDSYECKYSDENLTAIIIDCLGDTGEEIIANDGTSIRNFLKEDAKAWTANTMKTDYYYECTVDNFKTILCGYDFIDIRCHGVIDKNGNPAISVKEKDGMFNQKYMDDVHAGRVGRAYGAFCGEYYMKNSFFSYYYNDKLTSSIVWLGCCSGYKNDTLVEAFAQCGAKVVIGATDTVISKYGTVMTDAFVNRLLRSESVEDSLKFAKSTFGNNDKEKISPNKKENSAEFKIYNGSSEKLVDIKLKNPKGSISGYVVDDDGNPIENAEVGFIKITQIGYKPPSVKTDKNGYFFSEVEFDPEYADCSFTIFIQANGYEEYIGESDEGFSAGENKNAGNFILSKKKNDNNENEINENEMPQIINNVLQNENEWIETINNQNDMDTNYNTVAGGDDYIWFQDMDMDGEPEFITISKYMPGTDVGTFRSFNIYSNKDNKLSFIATENSAVPQSGMIYAENGSFETDTFNYSLWYDKNGKYHYFSSGSSGNVVLGHINELIIDANKVSEEPVITVYDENLPNKGCDINYIRDENGVGYSFDNVLYADGVKFYDDYFSYLSSCDTTVKKIKLMDYKTMTKEEKNKALLDSYNSWAYTKNDTIKQPLEDVIDSIRNQMPVSSTSDEYKESYKSLITGLSYEDSITNIEYTLYDMNNDNIPELILRTGTCEADYKISFYTYKNNIGLTPVGTNFSGFHTAFYVDKSTNQLCTQWGQNGIGGIKWYDFDGETVKEVKSQNNIEYATENVKFDNYADAYAPYGDFESLNSSNCFLSWNKGWIYYIDETLFLGIDYSLIDNY